MLFVTNVAENLIHFHQWLQLLRGEKVKESGSKYNYLYKLQKLAQRGLPNLKQHLATGYQ